MGVSINKEILLFCQAPADLPSILTIYKNNEEKVVEVVANLNGTENSAEDIQKPYAQIGKLKLEVVLIKVSASLGI